MEKTNFRKSKLGRLTIGVTICILMLTTSVATTIGNNINEQMNINSLSYTFLFKEPTFKSITQDSSEYTLIDIQGCLAAGQQAGDPQIPIKAVSLLLPPKKAVSGISVVGDPVQIESPINLMEKPIFPYQNSVPFGIEMPQDIEFNINIYSSDTPFPSAIFTDYSIGYSHGYAIIDFCLYPVQYIPSDGTIIFYPEMTVTINLEDNDYINPLLQNNPEDESWIQNLVSNPEISKQYRSLDLPTFEYPGGLCNPSESYDYVIITTTYNGLDYWDTGGTLTYNWESLMDKHQADDGLSCTLVTVQDIDACSDYQGSNPFNDQQAHIREFCKDAYEDWGTRYVLIGGDGESSYIPARDMDTNYETDIDADIYWSNLDSNFNSDGDNQWGESGDSGFDLYSDLYIGRVTCDTPQDVSNWLTKNFYYADSSEDTYLDNAAFYGGNTGWQCEGDDFMDYSAIKGTDDWLGPNPHNDGPFPTWAGFQFGFETWDSEHEGNQFDLSVKWTAEPPNAGGWQGGSESAAINGLKNDINADKVTLLSGIAHADPTMSLDVYSSSWESQYTNTKPFFIHDYGCHCGDFDDSDDGVLHSMLFHSNTELAFGCVFNTCYGWGNLYCTNSSSAFQTKEFWSYFLDMENKSEDYANWQLGKGHAFSKDRMAPTIATQEWDAGTGTWRAIIQGCLLFGDPAQIIKTPHPSAPPEKPSAPVGKTPVVWFLDNSYTSSTTEPDSEQIFYLFDWDDGNTSDWLGPYDGGQIVTAHHAWTELGTYEVRVKAKDIWGAGSPWSDPLMVTVTDNNPPEAPTIQGATSVMPFKTYTYTLNTTDADGDDVRYYVDWGDGESKWYGSYASGETISVDHNWKAGKSHTIKVKARDSLNDESDWSYLKVTLPRGNVITFNLLLQRFLEKFPSAFPIIKMLFN